jgi:type III secretory pathway lipoprotein EscJ
MPTSEYLCDPKCHSCHWQTDRQSWLFAKSEQVITRYSILIHQGNRQPILAVDGVFSDILMVSLPQKNKDGFRPITPNIIAIFISLRRSYQVNRFHRTIVSLREIIPRNSLLGKI